jgi:hypothetical protein
MAYRDEKLWEAMSARERAAYEQACQDSEQDLFQSHHLIDVKDLPDNTALTVRIVNGDLSVADGSVGGCQEQLLKILIIQAQDLNAAIQIASKMPQARGGPIEVRSIVESKR